MMTLSYPIEGLYLGCLFTESCSI